jgi:hypothetical protein
MGVQLYRQRKRLITVGEKKGRLYCLPFITFSSSSFSCSIVRSSGISTSTCSFILCIIIELKRRGRKLDDILGQIDNPVVKKELAKNLQYKFENGQSFTLEEWNQWREEGWRKVFEELKKRKD